MHTDFAVTNREIVPYLVEAARAAELDALVICGDISPSLMHIARFLSAFEEIACAKFFIAGNHDVWVMTYEHVTSEQKYKVLDAVCQACGFHHLAAGPQIVQNMGICGTIGWYDYSFRDNRHAIPLEQYESKQWQQSVWRDRDYARWGLSDVEVASRFAGQLRQQLSSLPASVSSILIATHHVPFRECVTYRGHLPRDFFAAFMGSQEIGEICLSDERVSHIIFGHTHHAISGQVGEVAVASSPVGYLVDTPDEGLRTYAANRLAVLQVDTH